VHKKYKKQIDMDKGVIFHRDARLIVKAPYNESFIEKAKALGGAWSASEKAWYFRKGRASEVEQILLDIYGTTNSINENTELKIVFNTEVRFAVRAPYNKDFIEGAKAINGVWSANEKVWYFCDDYEVELRQLLDNVFGKGNYSNSKKI
jgi:hypothetical protein